MANRSSTAAFQTEIVKDQNQPIHLVEIYFDSPTGTQYLTDAYISITYDSNTYSPLGYFLTFSNIDETTQLQVNGINLNISGVDQTYISHVLDENFVDRKVIIRKAFLSTTDDSLIADPIIIFQGNTNSPSISEAQDEGLCTVSIEVANQFVDFEKTGGRYTNSESQKMFYPDDLGFQYAPQIIKDIVWGAEFDPGTRNAGGDDSDGSVIDDFDIGYDDEVDIIVTGNNVTVETDGDVVINDQDNNIEVDDTVVIDGAIGDFDDDINGTHVVTASTEDTFTYSSEASPSEDQDFEGGSEIQVNDESISPGVTTTDTSNEIIIPYYSVSAVLEEQDTVTISNMETVGGIDASKVNGNKFEVKEIGTNFFKLAITEPITNSSPPLETDTTIANKVTINETDHGYNTGDSVVIAGSDAVGGVPAGEINATHTVGSIEKDSFQVTVSTTPTSTVTHGGGTGVTIAGESPQPPPLSVTSDSATTTVFQSAHGLSASDKVRLSGVQEIGGLPISVLNKEHTVVSVPDANSFTFTASQNATSTATGGGNLIVLNVPVKATSSTVGGGKNTTIKLPINNLLMSSL